jgi:hypothetical protein
MKDVIGNLKRTLHRSDGTASPAGGEATAPATMHKGANVVAHLFVEGEDAPAHDFTVTAIAATQAVLAAGSAATPLKVTVKHVTVDDDSPDADQ